MGRLIDAYELIEIVKGSEELLDFQKDELIACVDACDTAYDVEKVVEQLEQQASQYKRRALELVEKSTEAGIHNKGKALSYEHAIEIVRNGGVE